MLDQVGKPKTVNTLPTRTLTQRTRHCFAGSWKLEAGSWRAILSREPASTVAR